MHNDCIHSLLQSAKHKLSEAGIESAGLDARILLSFVTCMSTEDIVLNPQLILSAEHIEKFKNAVARRTAHEPVAKIIGRKEFYGRDFAVTRDTLDPRPDSEILIETALKILPKDKQLRILDLGTGTGCLLLTLLCELPNATGVAVDISRDAMDVAEFNAESLNVGNRTEFICGSMFDSVSGTFDCIISNPPYICESEKPQLSRDVLDYDPHIALFAPDNGLYFYQHIVSKAHEFLNNGGVLMFETGFRQAESVADMMKNNYFTHLEKKKDLSGTYRTVYGYSENAAGKKCVK